MSNSTMSSVNSSDSDRTRYAPPDNKSTSRKLHRRTDEVPWPSVNHRRRREISRIPSRESGWSQNVYPQILSQKSTTKLSKMHCKSEHSLHDLIQVVALSPWDMMTSQSRSSTYETYDTSSRALSQQMSSIHQNRLPYRTRDNSRDNTILSQTGNIIQLLGPTLHQHNSTSRTKIRSRNNKMSRSPYRFEEASGDADTKSASSINKYKNNPRTKIRSSKRSPYRIDNASGDAVIKSAASPSDTVKELLKAATKKLCSSILKSVNRSACSRYRLDSHIDHLERVSKKETRSSEYLQTKSAPKLDRPNSQARGPYRYRNANNVRLTTSLSDSQTIQQKRGAKVVREYSKGVRVVSKDDNISQLASFNLRLSKPRQRYRNRRYRNDSVKQISESSYSKDMKELFHDSVNENLETEPELFVSEKKDDHGLKVDLSLHSSEKIRPRMTWKGNHLSQTRSLETTSNLSRVNTTKHNGHYMIQVAKSSSDSTVGRRLPETGNSKLYSLELWNVLARPLKADEFEIPFTFETIGYTSYPFETNNGQLCPNSFENASLERGLQPLLSSPSDERIQITSCVIKEEETPHHTLPIAQLKKPLKRRRHPPKLIVNGHVVRAVLKVFQSIGGLQIGQARCREFLQWYYGAGLSIRLPPTFIQVSLIRDDERQVTIYNGEEYTSMFPVRDTATRSNQNLLLLRVDGVFRLLQEFPYLAL